MDDDLLDFTESNPLVHTDVELILSRNTTKNIIARPFSIFI